MFKIFNSLIDANAREIKKLSVLAEGVNKLENKIAKFTDKKLKDEANALKAKISKGAALDSVLPEAFALTREASKRINKERPYDVQLMAAITLHKGKIAEQKTGEGKTLSAAPAVVLNAMTGRGVHVVTVNDYLAQRDAGWIGPIYNMLGLTTGVIIHDQSFVFDPKYINKSSDDPRLKHLRPVARREAYAADITYGTNNEFGFDYLRDNMARTLDAQSQRGHYFAIVDEVDSILIDEARTPLIISAPGNESTDRYVEFTKVIDNLNEEGDYVIDEKVRSVNLTERGILKVEKILGVDNLYERDFKTLHHLEEALKARTLFKKDRDYVVRDGEVIIVDEFTGRLMPGRRYSEGLHQAIEAKEGVEIQQESKTMASISFQNYFRMYEKLAGMTGTAATEAEEFHKIYKLDVVVIPTNKEVARVDFPDAIFKTRVAKYSAVADEIARVHETGQPILVGTTSIDKNEALSELLKRKKISHALLNAKNHAKEAEIIAKAGQKGAVTVATNLAGRGVDIKLGTGVDKLGGLYVLGTERHESRRIDNQLRGRSGRQGDHGTSKFFVSLEDDLMRIFGGDQVARMMNFLKVPEDMPIENSLVSKALEGAQKKGRRT
jgi:preprotein translocase subunit SecA